VGEISYNLVLIILRAWLILHSNILMTSSMSSYLSLSLRVLIQLSNIGYHPISLGSINTIPHLDTVAGLATNKSIGSNIIFIYLFIPIFSPLLRHNVLLSSNTVFMFSIQMASTGPSNNNHFLYGLSSLARFLNLTAINPSVHSLVTKSLNPYNNY